MSKKKKSFNSDPPLLEVQMRIKQKPMLMQSPMTGAWYLCLSYEFLGDGKFKAIHKIDIDEELRRVGLIV